VLTFTYDITLVAASVAVSLMAAFTGLTLTNGISRLPQRQRKMLIAMASLTLGGGIWSMHFVAMLALQLPVLIFYDPLLTLGSALIAILLSGIALLIMHFGARSRRNIIVAGAILGSGIVVMHYVGMVGMRGCLPDFQTTGKILAAAFAMVMGITAIWIAYGKRTKLNILAGTIVFGLSVVIVHFTAMYWTGFAALPHEISMTSTIENSTLALIVTLSAFFICGTFLLSAATFVLPAGDQEYPAPTMGADAPPVAGTAVVDPRQSKAHGLQSVAAIASTRVPFERDNRIHFISSEDIAAIRADGRYTVLYISDQKLFCPWSISEAEERLPHPEFQKTHRSYIINTRHVTGFERRKDTGVCLFDDFASLTTVPVSRTKVGVLREVLGF